jgi:hypothetical protein
MPEAFSLEIALRQPDSVIFRYRHTIFYSSLSFCFALVYMWPDSVIFRSRLTIFYPSLSFCFGSHSESVYCLRMYLVRSMDPNLNFG